MILAYLGQRSYNMRTTFRNYTDSVLELSGQNRCPKRANLKSIFLRYHALVLLSSATG